MRRLQNLYALSSGVDIALLFAGTETGENATTLLSEK